MLRFQKRFTKLSRKARLKVFTSATKNWLSEFLADILKEPQEPQGEHYKSHLTQIIVRHKSNNKDTVLSAECARRALQRRFHHSVRLSALVSWRTHCTKPSQNSA